MVAETARMPAEARRVVLLVGDDPAQIAELGGWLVEAGHDLRLCPGPSAPRYECVGSRTGRCPLAEGADAVVLCLPLPGDLAMEGASGADLRALYETVAPTVIMLMHGRLAGSRIGSSRSHGLRPRITRDELVRAVAGQRLVTRSREPAPRRMSDQVTSESIGDRIEM